MRGGGTHLSAPARFFNALTLAEMMVVMLILSIVMAAFAPVMTTRSKTDRNSPWRYASDNSNIYYGLGENQTAMIGQPSKNINLDPSSRLIITTSDNEQKHIVFKRGQDNLLGSLYISDKSVFLGDGSTKGNDNVGIGIGALKNNSGSNNIGIGINTLLKSSGDNNTAIGNNAMKSNTSGTNNSALGAALINNTTGSQNTSLGNDSMANSTTGSNNTVIGVQALYSNNTSDNTAVGYQALYNATSGGNTAFGAYAGKEIGIYGSETSSFGNNAQAKTQGATALGAYSISSGYLSLASGIYSKASAEESSAYGNNSTASGKLSVAIAPHSSATALRSTAVGNNSFASGIDSTAIGSNANAFSGVAVGSSTKASGDHSTALGSVSTASGDQSIAIAYGSVASGRNSTAIGAYSAAAGANNISIGYNACKNVTGSNKTCIGANSGPTSYDQRTDTSTESYYIGSPGRFVSGKTNIDANSIFELHKKGDYAVAFLNADLVVNGFTWTQVGGKSGHNDAIGFFRSKTWKNQVELYNETRPGFPPASPFSDRRLKYVGQEFTTGLDKIKQLRVFNYTFKDDEKKTPHIGVIAQDLQKIFPEAVFKDEETGFLKIRTEDMFYALINSVKEVDEKICSLASDIKSQAQTIKQLRDENKLLKERVDNLEKRLDKLERQLK